MKCVLFQGKVLGQVIMLILTLQNVKYAPLSKAAANT